MYTVTYFGVDRGKYYLTFEEADAVADTLNSAKPVGTRAYMAKEVRL